MVAVLLARGDGADDHHAVARHLAQQRPGHVVEAHECSLLTRLRIAREDSAKVKGNGPKEKGKIAMSPALQTKRLLTVAFLVLPFSLTGCQSKDAERLAALGARLREKAQGLAASGPGPLRGLQTVPVRLGELSL